LVEYKKKMDKINKVILDYMKDDLIPHITGKTMGKKIFDSLVTLYQSENIER
jgi:hypothetical protein